MLHHIIERDALSKVVLCTATGVLSVKTALQISQANLLAYDLGYSLIYDVSRTRLVASIVEAYEFVRDRTALFGDPTHIPKKIAVVRSPGNDEFWEFYQTTALNAGLPVQVFDFMEVARDWCMD